MHKKHKHKAPFCAADFVIAERINHKRKQYLIRWTGFSCKHDSWSSEITPDLALDWKKHAHRTRKWTRFLQADKVLAERGQGTQSEFLVKFKDYPLPEWTYFINDHLKQEWNQSKPKPRKRSALS